AAANPPDSAGAVALVTAWRTAVHAAPCDRKKPSDPVVCSGTALVPMMPAPVQFGMTTDASWPDGCEPWHEANGMSAVAAGADYDMLTPCAGALLEEDQRPPITSKTYAQVETFLSKAVRKQWKPLAKTDAFVLIEHKPTSADPGRFEAVLAVAPGDDGKPRV